jgi:hypothetical protein
VKTRLYFLFLSFICFALLTFIFYAGGEKTSPDSKTYQYFLRPTEILYSDYSVQRPEIFPALIWIIKSLPAPSNISLFLLITYLIRSLTIATVAWLAYSQTKNKVLTILTGLLCVSNLLFHQYLNFLIPETLLSFFIAVHLVSLRRVFVNQPKPQHFFFLLATFPLLTFTKPIFLLYPFVYLLLMTIRFLIKKQSQLRKTIINNKRQLLHLSLFFLLTYILPVHIKSLQNLKSNGTYSFSAISDVNLAGKVIHHDLATKGPTDPKYLPLRTILDKDTRSGYLYEREDLILSVLPKDEPFNRYFSEFSKKTILLNLKEYLYLSILEIPAIVEERYVFTQNAPPEHSYYFAFNLHLFFWNPIYSFYAAIIIFIVIAAIISFKKENFFFISALVLWVYLMTILTLSAYGGYVRLRSTFDDVFVLLLVLSIDTLWQALISLTKSKQIPYNTLITKPKPH